MLHHPFRLLLSIFLGIAALTQLVLSAPTKGVTENTKVLGLKATSFQSKARVLTNWRLAECISALKAFDATMLNQLMVNK